MMKQEEDNERNRREYRSDYSNRDFTSYSKDEIRDINFTDADLRGANFEGCQHLYNKNFTRANIYRANFKNTNIRGANFESVENQLDSSDFYSVTFEGANICGANFENADLKRANFNAVKTDYSWLWGLLIKLSTVFLSVLAAIVLFHSVDMLQTFFTPDEISTNLSSKVSLMIEAVPVVPDIGESSTNWPKNISEITNNIRTEFESIIQDSLDLSSAILENCYNHKINFYQDNPRTCRKAEDFFEIVSSEDFVVGPVILFGVIAFISACIIFLFFNANLFGIIIVFIDVAIALGALNESIISIPIFQSLTALLGIVSGILVHAISTAVSIAAEFSRRQSKSITALSWFLCVCSMFLLATHTIPPDLLNNLIWLPLLSSICALGLGSYIGKKSLADEERTIFRFGKGKFSGQDKRHFLLEFFTIRLLRFGPVTKFNYADLKEASFLNAKLKEYSTSIIGNYDDEIIRAIFRKGDGSKRYYEKMLRLSSIFGSNLLYGGFIYNIVNNQIKEFLVYGDFINNGVINWGKVIGSVNNSVHESSERNIKSLSELQKLLEESDNVLPEEVKQKALSQIENLVNVIHSESENH